MPHFKKLPHFIFFLLGGQLFLVCHSADAQTFTSSKHPIVVINTGSDEIPDEPKIPASMGIIANGNGAVNYLSDPFNQYDGNIGIETRGNSTQGFDKKSYSVELWNEQGEDSSAALLGMPAEEDWILHAMVIDKTQLRIPYSFYLWERMGHYATRWRFVELVIDGEYRGLYLLMEKIKQGEQRVAVKALNEENASGEEGGYILRIDWLDEAEGFASQYRSQGEEPMFFQWYYPKASKVKPEQAAYIENWMHRFEKALFNKNCTGSGQHPYTDFIDLHSFIDFVLINELSKNADGYKLSSYVHKHAQSEGGGLVAGPIWDFDQTYGVSEVCSNSDPTGWTYLQNQEGCEDLESMPMWWQSLLADTFFRNQLNRRWKRFRTSFLHEDSVKEWIDTTQRRIDEAIGRNFTRWDDFIGNSIWYEPEPLQPTYQHEVQYLKDWITKRLEWMDANIAEISTEVRQPVHLYPNITAGLVHVESETPVHSRVLDMNGRLVLETNTSPIDLGPYPQGLYLVEVFRNNESLCVRKVMKQ